MGIADIAASGDRIKTLEAVRDKLATDLDYVPLPDSVVALVKDEWKQIKDKDGKPVLTQ